jgi:hypothetical protein
MNKKELMTNIETGRQQLEIALAHVDDERMPLIVLHGEWSVKDLIGHLSFWENTVVALFNTLKAGRIPEPLPELDALNAQVLTASRKQSLAEVRRQEKAAYQKLIALVQAATETELFDGRHFPWTEGRPFAELVADNSYGHYAEHLPELAAWLKRVA